MGKDSIKQISYNRSVRHDYFVDETLEVGIELFGTEVKSIRAGHTHLRDAWCDFIDGELYVKQMHISPYEQGNIFNRDPLRVRKLLLHKREIIRLYSLVKQKGVTIIPIQIYFKGNKVKLEIGVCRGKKLYDKREDMAKRDAKRDIDRAMKERNR